MPRLADGFYGFFSGHIKSHARSGNTPPLLQALSITAQLLMIVFAFTLLMISTASFADYLSFGMSIDITWLDG